MKLLVFFILLVGCTKATPPPALAAKAEPVEQVYVPEPSMAPPPTLVGQKVLCRLDANSLKLTEAKVKAEYESGEFNLLVYDSANMNYYFADTNICVEHPVK